MSKRQQDGKRGMREGYHEEIFQRRGASDERVGGVAVKRTFYNILLVQRNWGT